MLALQHYRDALVCPICGGPISECTDPDSEGRYQAQAPVRCHRTTVMSAQADEYSKKAKQPGALLYSAELKPK